MKKFWSRIKAVSWTGTLIVAMAALLLSASLGGFYLSDTIQGKGTSLGQVLKVVGFCPAPSGDLSGSGIAGPKGDQGEKGDTGATGPSGAPGKDATVMPAPAPVTTAGPAGTKGSTGASGAPGTTGEAGETGAPGATGATGAAGTCTALDTASLAGDLIPAQDNTYSLGTVAMRWRSLQLGPGTLYIQDTVTGNQAGITISDGTLLLDGVDTLRIGNVRFTSTGITSLLQNQDITIGSFGDTGWMSVAHGIKFPDGTTMTTAGGQGPVGPQGPQGPRGLTGATGPQGPMGTIDGYAETNVCMYAGKPSNTPTGTLMAGTCAELGQEGKDIQILVKQ